MVYTKTNQCFLKAPQQVVKLKNGHPWSKSVQHSNIETRQKEQLENVQSMSGLFCSFNTNGESSAPNHRVSLHNTQKKALHYDHLPIIAGDNLMC